MPKIKRISTSPLFAPLHATLHWGRGHSLPALRHVLVRVELSDGALGIAEATPRPSIYGETQASIAQIIADEIAPRWQGLAVSDFASVAKLSADLAQIKANNTAKGALDMALHTALAQSRGDNMRDYLGATRDSLRLSYIVSAGGRDEIVADVAAIYAKRVRVFKVKIGRDIPSETGALRELLAAFPAAEFYVDANETLSPETAAQTLDKLHDMGVRYCEEPLPTHLLRQRARLRRGSAMPLIADDSAFTPRDLQRELDFDSFDILNIKTARTGFSDSLRMLGMAAERGKGAMVGSQAGSLLGCLQAALFAGRAEVDCPSECSFWLKTDADLSHAPAIVDGRWRLADVEGALDSLRQFNYGSS